ncbi:MAG: hypothetical protein ACRDT6_00795 [Micromonosporaceae bacterium]
MIARLAGAVRLELRTELRYGIVLTALALTTGWTLALLAMPGWLARAIGPYLLVADTAAFGAFFIAALVLYERVEGALAALAASPLRFGEYLGVKLALLTLLSVGSAVPIMVAAFRGAAFRGGGGGLVVLLGVALISVLVLALNAGLVASHRSLTDFLLVAPFPLVPLMLAPLLQLSGVVSHPLLYLVPTVGAADLVAAATHPVSPPRIAGIVAYLLLWIAGAVWFARWRFVREFLRPGRVRMPAVGTRRAWPRSGWLVAYARLELRAVTRSAMLLVVLVGPLLLAVALRLAYPWLEAGLAARFGVTLAPYRPLLLATLVVLHVPLLCGMVGALLVLDDADDRTLVVLRVSPVTLPRYLAWRGTVVAAVAAVSLTIAVPLSGLAPWSGLPAMLPALLLAATQAPLIMLATAAYASNKVEGLALIKLLGGIVTAVAPALWWLPTPWTWPLHLLPPAWVLDTLWHPTPQAIAGATVTTATAMALLARRTLRRISSA